MKQTKITQLNKMHLKIASTEILIGLISCFRFSLLQDMVVKKLQLAYR